MSGGIARFARKPGAAAASDAVEEQKETADVEESGEFGGGDDDASFGGFGDFGGRNTPSDDFGFMGGGGGESTGGGFDFMGDGGFNEDEDVGFEEDNSMMMEVRKASHVSISECHCQDYHSPKLIFDVVALSLSLNRI
jgi:hypothetical protein